MLIQIWCMVYYTIDAAFGYPKVEFLSKDIDHLFKQLEAYGQTELEKYKEQHKGDSDFVRQYLTVAVLSDKEVKDPNWLKGDNSRLQVILNRKIEKGVFHTNHKIPLHGEIILLHLESKIDEMLNSFKGKQKDSFPFVFVFSFYIPCANIKNIEYSCSEELAHHALLHSKEYQMVVGWTTNFEEIKVKTDVESSKKFMSLGGIQQYEKQNGFFKKQSTNELLKPPEKLIQDLYFKCLNSTPHEECCVINSLINVQVKNDRKQGILSYFINSMYYKCTQDSKWNGPLTQLTLGSLSKCTDNYINEHTGNDCEKCSSHRTKNLLQTCSLYSQAHATHIGKPSNIDDFYNPEWIQGTVSWSDLYKGYTGDITKNHPMYCFKSDLSMESLCTKMGEDYKNIPQKYQSKIQQIKSKTKMAKQKKNLVLKPD